MLCVKRSVPCRDLGGRLGDTHAMCSEACTAQYRRMGGGEVMGVIGKWLWGREQRERETNEGAGSRFFVFLKLFVNLCL